MQSEDPTLSPVSSPERIEALDVIRALALFGVLQMNLLWFSGDVYRLWAKVPFSPGWGGVAFQWLRDSLLAGKAMTLFSMLFGIGLSIQLERAGARGASFLGFGARRLAILALLGVVHGTVLWVGDVLLTYALTGLLLLGFMRNPRRNLMGWVLAALLLSAFQRQIFDLLHMPPTFRFSHWAKQGTWLFQEAQRAYGEGTWMAAFKWRFWEWCHLGRALHLSTPWGVVPLFLMGMVLWRSGLIQDPAKHATTIRRWFHGCFWWGLALQSIPDGWWDRVPQAWMEGLRGSLVSLVMRASVLALAVGYLMGVLMLLMRPWWREKLGRLAPLGRMALTNYLTHSLVWSWVFYHHGLGLWLRLSPMAYFALGLPLYAGQLLFSAWWLGRFRFGPMEWVWRSLTYGKAQPLRREPLRPILVRPAMESE